MIKLELNIQLFAHKKGQSSSLVLMDVILQVVD